MKRARRLLLHCRRILLPALLMVVMSAAASAATVRGRLERKLPNGAQGPAAGVAVTVYSQTSKKRSPSRRTDAEGMYYITVPAGSYLLEVWPSTAPGAKPLRYQIPRVVEPSTDIQPIVLP
jgi:hypothetical protein